MDVVASLNVVIFNYMNVAYVGVVEAGAAGKRREANKRKLVENDDLCERQGYNALPILRSIRYLLSVVSS